MVQGLQHGVKLGLGACSREKLLDARHAHQPHVLGYLNGVGAPRRNHFAARSHVGLPGVERRGVNVPCARKEPLQLLNIACLERLLNAYRQHAGGGLKEENHF